MKELFKRIGEWFKMWEITKYYDNFDYYYLFSIEQYKLREMYKYYSTSDISYKDIVIARNIRWTIKMIDIILEKSDTPSHINIKNANRFNMDNIYISKDDLYIEKAKHLYSLLKGGAYDWWD